MRRAVLTDEDRDAWALYARAVRRLPGRTAPAPVGPPAPPPAPAPESPPAVPPRAMPPPLAIGVPAGLDRATWDRLRAGRFPVARRIDLHGHTVQRAHDALAAFLCSAHAEGARCVEIVTGRGSALGSGVIRRELPLWLNLPALRPMVLAAVHPARNPGTTLVLLRRDRTARTGAAQAGGRAPNSAVPTRTSVAP